MGAGGVPGKLRLSIDENLEGIRWDGQGKGSECQTYEGAQIVWSPSSTLF
jgi:hypothetical protein